MITVQFSNCCFRSATATILAPLYCFCFAPAMEGCDQITEEAYHTLRAIFQKVFECSSKVQFKEIFTTESEEPAHQELRDWFAANNLASILSMHPLGQNILGFYRRCNRNFKKKEDVASKAKRKLLQETCVYECQPVAKKQSNTKDTEAASPATLLMSHLPLNLTDKRKILLVFDLNKVLVFRKPKKSRYSNVHFRLYCCFSSQCTKSARVNSPAYSLSFGSFILRPYAEEFVRHMAELFILVRNLRQYCSTVYCALYVAVYFHVRAQHVVIVIVLSSSHSVLTLLLMSS